jgi:hypothetical protein
MNKKYISPNITQINIGSARLLTGSDKDWVIDDDEEVDGQGSKQYNGWADFDGDGNGPFCDQ